MIVAHSAVSTCAAKRGNRSHGPLSLVVA